MKIENREEQIDYNDTKKIFDNRVRRFYAENPYSVTMYQDDNPELVKIRNEREIQTLLPLLSLDRYSNILDVACGIGRWSDAIDMEIEGYCGIDFCEGLINIANSRNKRDKRHFLVGKSTELQKAIASKFETKFNRVLLVGALMYLNDVDVLNTLTQVEQLCNQNARICIREPIGISSRLTLKKHFSEELKDTYNAIYRTHDELLDLLNKTLINKGFFVTVESFLFEDKDVCLNNRKETAQYYFILER